MSGRVRCRRRKLVSTVRCQRDEGHEGLHGAWNGDVWLEWTTADSSPELVRRRGAPLSRGPGL